MPVGFLSEMVAQPVHGGGITLRRVLGEDLDRFDWIAKTLHYTAEKKPKYGQRCQNHCYEWWKIEPFLRPVLGCSLAYRMAFHPRVRAAFARSVARRLLGDQPDLLESRILVCPQADITVLVLEELKTKSKIRYVTWVMDDHMLKWQGGEWIYPAGFERQMHRHLRDAEHVHVISPALQEFYKSRFGIDSTVLCGPADAGVPPPRRIQSGDRLKLAYFGSLGPWQNDAMELLIPALGRGEIALDVFSHNPDAIPPALKSAGAELRAGVSAKEVLTLCGRYDAVVLPISFKEKLRNMSYFNIATKFSECLASGVPTLIIGPPDSIMLKIAAAKQAAVIVDQCDADAVLEALKTLRDPEKSGGVIRAALQLSNSEFSTDVMLSRFEASRKFLFDNSASVN
jgi:hypothetical protein